MNSHLRSSEPAIRVTPITHGRGFRALGLRAVSGAMDPFLMVDHYWMSEPTFGPHPHAGLSALTYLFEDSATGLLNRDSKGVSCLIEPGALHWMLAGGGVVHDEVPRARGQVAHGLQIFVNLPASEKQSVPRALRVAASEMPVFTQGCGARVRVVAGTYRHADDAWSVPLAVPNEVLILDVRVPAGLAFDFIGCAGHNAFAYVVEGSIEFGQDTLCQGEAISVTESASPQRFAAAAAAHLMLFSGLPLREPLVWRGPFAMSSEEEMERAIDDFRRGRMGHLATAP